MQQNEILAIANKILNIPTGFKLASYELVAHDNTPVYWLRFHKENSQTSLGGEHFSCTISKEDHKLMGLMHLEDKFDTDSCIEEEKAKEIALKFLKDHAEDLIDTVEIRWIRPTRKIPIASPHDDGFTLNSGKIITGMRVKLWANNNKTYAWVIVHPSGEVISFERDIIWNTLKRRRTTNRWLHDSWIKETQQTIEPINC
jgi:hypothetical protein